MSDLDDLPWYERLFMLLCLGAGFAGVGYVLAGVFGL